MINKGQLLSAQNLNNAYISKTNTSDQAIASNLIISGGALTLKNSVITDDASTSYLRIDPQGNQIIVYDGVNNQMFSLFGSSGSDAIQISTITGSPSHSLIDVTSNIDHLEINTGTNKNVIFGSGRVGIGTHNPQSPLDIFTNSNVYALTMGDESNSNLKIAGTAGGDTGYGLLQTFTAGTTAGGNLVLQRDAGFVGIGTTSPSYKLDVNGGVNIQGSNSLNFGTYGGGFNMTDTTWIRTVGNKSFYHNQGEFRTDGTLEVGNVGSTLKVVNGGNFAYNSNVLFATPSGYVGINNSNPQHVLDVIDSNMNFSLQGDHIQLQMTGKQNYPYIAFVDSGNVRGGYIGWGTIGDHIDFALENGNDLVVSGGKLVAQTGFTADDGSQYRVGSGIYGNSDMTIVNEKGAMTVGGAGIWLKHNNYYNGSYDIFYNSTDTAWQVHSDKTNGLLIRKSTNTPSGGAQITWGSDWAVWHAGNDGSGSGLDADKLDGLDSSQFLRSDTSDSFSGNLTLTGSLLVTNNGSGIQWKNGSTLTSEIFDNAQLTIQTDDHTYFTSLANGTTSASWDFLTGVTSGTNNTGTSVFHIDGTGKVNSQLNTLDDGTGQMTINGGTGTYQGVLLNNGWFRTKGNYGLYFQDYGGGWFMQDTTWIRGYNNKNLYMNTGVIRTDGSFQMGASQGTAGMIHFDNGNWASVDAGIWSDNASTFGFSASGTNSMNLLVDGSITADGGMFSTTESHFSTGTYTDPQSGSGRAIKASGGIATDYIWSSGNISVGGTYYVNGVQHTQMAYISPWPTNGGGGYKWTFTAIPSASGSYQPFCTLNDVPGTQYFTSAGNHSRTGCTYYQSSSSSMSGWIFEMQQ